SLAGERFAGVPLRKQAPEDECFLASALFRDRIGHVFDNDSPVGSGVLDEGIDGALLIGRGQILVGVATAPAVAVGQVVTDLDRPVGIGSVGLPGSSQGFVRCAGLNIDERDPGIAFRRFKNRGRSLEADRPAYRGDEGIAKNGGFWRVGRQALGSLRARRWSP